MDKEEIKKVLFVVPLPPPVHGSTVMCQYIKDSKLINEQFDCDYVNLSASRSTTEVHKFQLIKIWRVISILLQVFWRLVTRKYDLCYVALAFHGSLLKDAPVVLLCKLFRRRVVIHLHGKGASEDAKNGFYHWLLKKTFKNTKVILLSWLLYPDVEEYVKKDDVMICPNGIPPVQSVLQKRKNIVPRLLFLSNLIESKGVIVLLDALKILKDKGYSFVCDFVGGETAEIDSQRFQKEVENRGLNELAVYSGKKYGVEKDNSFSQADIFVLPTMNDCFPLVILEAMSSEKPVVTTAIGGIPDMVEDGKTGLIAEAGNDSSLAFKLEQLLKNRDLIEQLGKEGKVQFHKNFSKEAFESCLNSAIKDTMGGANLVLCRYLGKMYGEDKTRAFCESDIFVFPTYYENECFPLVILEAMQQELPVVTTNEGAIRDIIKNGENGYISERKNPSLLADCLEHLLENPETITLIGKNNEEKFYQNYRINAYENTLCGIIENVVGGG